MRKLAIQVLVFASFFAFPLCSISNGANLTYNNSPRKYTPLRTNSTHVPSANIMPRQNPTRSSTFNPSSPKRVGHLLEQHTKGEFRWKSIPNRSNPQPS